VQEFPERIPIETLLEWPIHGPLNNIHRSRPGLLAVRQEAQTLFSVPSILDRRLQVRDGLALYYKTPGNNIFPRKTDPNIAHRKIPRRDIF
jgi:hypothetical protein